MNTATIVEIKRVRYVRCANGCGNLITLKRAECAISHGMCELCNESTLTSVRQERAPVPETRAWERGEQL